MEANANSSHLLCLLGPNLSNKLLFAPFNCMH